jgi:hypothetical protein
MSTGTHEKRNDLKSSAAEAMHNPILPIGELNVCSWFSLASLRERPRAWHRRAGGIHG